MSGALRLASIAAAAVLLAPVPARADQCDDAVVDPVPLGVRDAGFDRSRGACLRTEVLARVGGRALIDTADFYGTLGGDLVVGGRFVDRSIEWGLALRLADYTYVQNAVIKAGETSYGPIEASAAYGRGAQLAGRELSWAVMLVTELPFTHSTLETTSGALQLGAVVSWALSERISLHGRAATLAWFASSAGGTSGRTAFALSSEASFGIVAGLEASAGADAQVGWYQRGVDHLLVRIGVHLRLAGPWRLEAAAGTAVAGAERADALIVVGVRRDM